MMEEMVLSTDMSKHKEYIDEFEVKPYAMSSLSKMMFVFLYYRKKLKME